MLAESEWDSIPGRLGLEVLALSIEISQASVVTFLNSNNDLMISLI